MELTVVIDMCTNINFGAEVTYILPPLPVKERILRNKTWQDFSELWWLFLIKQLFHSRLLEMR